LGKNFFFSFFDPKKIFNIARRLFIFGFFDNFNPLVKNDGVGGGWGLRPHPLARGRMDVQSPRQLPLSCAYLGSRATRSFFVEKSGPMASKIARTVSKLSNLITRLSSVHKK
jgi:hypothetical protein